MPKQWVKDLKEGEQVQVEVCVLSCDIRTKKNGAPYLVFTFCDSSKKISAKWWEQSASERDAAQALRYARVWGKVNTYQGEREIILSCPPQDIGTPPNLEDFILASPIPVRQLSARLSAYIDSVRDPRLNALLHATFDPRTRQVFEEMPAAQDNHHAFRHGLLQHTLEVTDIVAAITEKQHAWGPNPLLHDLVVTGALLHDIGKVEEMAQDEDVCTFTSGGCLLGHITLGAIRIARKVAQVRKAGTPFPQELEEMLLHLITSHHGKGEWGSPKAPMTSEAILLHMADKMSTDLFYMQEARSQAQEDVAFIKQRKFDSGFGGAGRYVFVGDLEMLGAPWAEVKPSLGQAADSLPLPRVPNLPVLRLVRSEDSKSNTFATCRLPLLGKVAAGQPILHTDNVEEELVVESTGLRNGGAPYYLLRIQGDSMTGDDLQDGDIIVVRHQEQAEYGDLVVADLEGEGATVKRLVQRGNEVLLMPSNPDHAPIPVSDPRRLSIQGRVVGVAR